ncbi:MAG: flagellar biosynthesis protein FlgB [Pseudomonadota bacterium]
MADLSLMAALGERMRWLSARQGVVAANIASADLPGYRARDIAAPDFAAMVGNAAGRGGTPDVHMSESLARLRGGAQGLQGGADLRGTGIVKPNGNDVGLEAELLTLAEIQMDYAAMTNLYRKQTGLLKLALGRGSR